MPIRIPNQGPKQEMGVQSDKWDTWIYYLEDEFEKMTAKEIDFVESVSTQRQAGRKLTLKQEDWLEEIYRKVQEL